MKRVLVTGLSALALLAGGTVLISTAGAEPAQAQSSATSKQIVDAAKKRGEIGERVDGYLGAVGTVSAEVKAAMDDINISRKVEYERLADETGSTIRQVAQLTGERLIRRAAAGEYIMGPDGQWTKK